MASRFLLDHNDPWVGGWAEMQEYYAYLDGGGALDMLEEQYEEDMQDVFDKTIIADASNGDARYVVAFGASPKEGKVEIGDPQVEN